jgi:predicted acetyltransferase
MEIELRPVDEADKVVLERLVELYRYDFSEYRPYALTPHGTYGYRYLDHYFLDDAREACFVLVDGELAGFTMTSRLAGGARTMSEFFVVRSWRRRGVGTAVAHEVFARHPGRWRVAFDDTNAPAGAFWPEVCAAAARGKVKRVRKPDDAVYPGWELQFTTAEPFRS